MRRTHAVTLLFILFLAQVVLLPTPPASSQSEETRISVIPDKFFYQPGETAYLRVEITRPEGTPLDDAALLLRLYPSADTRSHLQSFREGCRSYAVFTKRLETLDGESEWESKTFELQLSSLGLSSGVYPFEVRVEKGGETLASDTGFLVIMDPQVGYPLDVVLLWTIDYLPVTDAVGASLDSGLSASCTETPEKKGFLDALVTVLKANPEVKSNLVVPPFIMSDLAGLAETEVQAETGEEESPSGREAQRVLEELQDLYQDENCEISATTFAFSDPTLLISLGWWNDAVQQMELGMETAEEMTWDGKGFVFPGFRLSDGSLQLLVSVGMEYTVVGRETLEYSEAGKRLLEGPTLSQPVNFVNSSGYLLKAFVLDENLFRYLENPPTRDSSHLVQNIFAELAVLQREKPYLERSCILAFPPGFLPGEDFLNKLYSSLKGCPWVRTSLLSDLHAEQPPLEGVALQAPPTEGASTSYTSRLSTVRGRILDLYGALPEDAPLREKLLHSLYLAEYHRFMEEDNAAAAQKYLQSLEDMVANEASRVRIERKSSITLSSTEGNLVVDITSGLDYPISCTLSAENHNVTFPEGNRLEVTIEPQENRFILPIETHRKGSFIIDITLKAGNTVIDSTTIAVRTSMINTLAVILLACLAGLVSSAYLARRLYRRVRKGGKHEKSSGKE